MKVVHCKKDKFDVYIGRPGPWGNPFSHLVGKGDVLVDSREDAIQCYEAYIRDTLSSNESEQLKSDLKLISGKVLGCWCSPKSCHGDVLIKICKELGYYKE